MSNYLLSLHVNYAARKSSLKKSQRVADHIMQSGTLNYIVWSFDLIFKLFLTYLSHNSALTPCSPSVKTVKYLKDSWRTKLN